jgi:DsbC/DsbD-like thiol-disulfide interchange protein
VRRRALTAALCASFVASLPAQQIGDFQPGSQLTSKAKSHISYAAEPQTLPAGRQGWIDLRFQVDPGYHVNSHTPKSDLLIPTELTIRPEDGVSLGKLQYPAGTSYSFPTQPDEKLDVYTGSFLVRLSVQAKAGDHTLSATLRYQACDHAACYPPKTLPVEIPFTAN